jgi:hypothetical protein
MHDDNENLSYVSSVDPFTPEPTAPSVDVADEKALVQVQKVLESQIKLYHTISGVKQFPKTLSVEQRFELCDHYTQLLGNLTKLINNAVEGVRKTNGRQ